ncbi:unnamed protein product [Dibothriocephalus latus]|uniref:Uncharacterized protein n=1 Tax=Dibothriocephalus latus TaxID=60516 RepID=A0A3P7LK49_DIBLA|nr:unnamed protein product [Dibothriocephalus latus]
MYFVVVFTTENSVDVVGEKWFHDHDKSRVMWLDNRKVRKRCLEMDERPPEGTPYYPVRILGNYFPLEEAHRRAKLAEKTSDLSSSEPTQKGRGCRRNNCRCINVTSADMLPAAMQAALKAMETRLEARFDARFEALESIVRQSNELNRRLYDKLT